MPGRRKRVRAQSDAGEARARRTSTRSKLQAGSSKDSRTHARGRKCRSRTHNGGSTKGAETTDMARQMGLEVKDRFARVWARSLSSGLSRPYECGPWVVGIAKTKYCLRPNVLLAWCNGKVLTRKLHGMRHALLTSIIIRQFIQVTLAVSRVARIAGSSSVRRVRPCRRVPNSELFAVHNH